MNPTPAQVKNIIRRGLRWLVDPELRKPDKQRIKEYFKNRCAFCNISIEVGNGDIDHLISAAKGGSNGLANRVLSCKPCNVAKTDQEWTEFLKVKARSPKLFSNREKKIKNWIEQNGGHPTLAPVLASLIDIESCRVIKAYEGACEKIRKAKKVTLKMDADISSGSPQL